MADTRHFMPAWIKGAKGGEYYISPNGTKIYRAGYGSKGMKERYKKGLQGGGAGPGGPPKPPLPPGVPHKPPPPAPPKAPPEEPKEKPEGRLARAKAGKSKGSIPSIDHVVLTPLHAENEGDAIRARHEPDRWVIKNHNQLVHAAQEVAEAVGGKKRTVMVGKFIHDSSQPNVAGYFQRGGFGLGVGHEAAMAPGKIALSRDTIANIADARQGGLNRKNFEGFKTLTHEIMHAASNKAHTYESFNQRRRPHAAIEEASTEIAAQHYTLRIAEKMGAQVKTDEQKAIFARPLFRVRGPDARFPKAVPVVEAHKAVSYATLVERFANVALRSRGIDVRSPAFNMAQHDDASITKNITAVAFEIKKRSSGARVKMLATDILKHEGVNVEAMTKVGESREYAARRLLITRLKKHFAAQPGSRESNHLYLDDAIKYSKAHVEGGPVRERIGPVKMEHGPGGTTTFTEG